MVLLLSGDERGGIEVMALADGCRGGRRWGMRVFWARREGIGVWSDRVRDTGCVGSDAYI